MFGGLDFSKKKFAAAPRSELLIDTLSFAAISPN
jgi:hypothetical protein